MCVIVTSQADTMPSLTQLARMSDANPDGAGIAWHDGQRLHRYRNEDNMKTLAFIMDHWQSLETSPFLLHFRLATHGRVCTGNTHPFRFSKGDRTGFIAHNGIAHSYTRGRHASDSRNAILAWQAGQADLADGSQGRFALIDHNGRLEWLTADHETIPGGTGAIEVSNTNWTRTASSDTTCGRRRTGRDSKPDTKPPSRRPPTADTRRRSTTRHRAADESRRPRRAGGDGPRQAKGLKPPFGNRAGPRPPEPTQAPHPATRGDGERKRNRRDRAIAAARTRTPPLRGPCPRARPTAPRARRPYRRMEPAKGGHGKNTWFGLLRPIEAYPRRRTRQRRRTRRRTAGRRLMTEPPYAGYASADRRRSKNKRHKKERTP